jgi:hypothetical protein
VGTSAERFSSFERHTQSAERDWSAFFAPRIMKFQKLERADMDLIPTPSPFVPSVSTTQLFWPLMGLSVSLALVAVVFAGPLRPVVR